MNNLYLGFYLHVEALFIKNTLNSYTGTSSLAVNDVSVLWNCNQPGSPYKDTPSSDRSFPSTTYIFQVF